MSKIDTSNTVDFNLDFGDSEVFGVNQMVKGVLTIFALANQVIDKIGYKFILETKGVYKTDEYVVFDQLLSNTIVLKKGNTYSFNIDFQNKSHQTYHGKNTSYLFKIEPYIILQKKAIGEDAFTKLLNKRESRIIKTTQYLEFVNRSQLLNIITPKTELKLTSNFKILFAIIFSFSFFAIWPSWEILENSLLKYSFLFLCVIVILRVAYLFLGDILFGKMEINLKDLKAELFEVSLKNNIEAIKHLDIHYQICEEVEKTGITYTDFRKQIVYQSETQKLINPPRSILALFEYPETSIPTIRFVDTRIYWNLEINIKTYLGIPFRYRGEFIVSNK